MNKLEEALQSELSLAMAVAALLRTMACPGRAAGWCVFWDGRYWLAGLMPYTIGLHSRPVCSPVGLQPNWAHPTFFLAFQAY